MNPFKWKMLKTHNHVVLFLRLVSEYISVQVTLILNLQFEHSRQ